MSRRLGGVAPSHVTSGSRQHRSRLPDHCAAVHRTGRQIRTTTLTADSTLRRALAPDRRILSAGIRRAQQSDFDAVFPKQRHDVPHLGDRFTGVVLEPGHRIPRGKRPVENGGTGTSSSNHSYSSSSRASSSAVSSPRSRRNLASVKMPVSSLWCWPSAPTTKRTNTPMIIPPAASRSAARPRSIQSSAPSESSSWTAKPAAKSSCCAVCRRAVTSDGTSTSRRMRNR